MYRKKAMLLAGVGMMILPQLTFGKTLGTVNADVLNVRSKPTTTSSIVKKVYAKDSVQITDLVGTSDRWYKVNVSGTEAYIKQEYLDLTRADGTVTATSLNIRSYPDVNKSKVIGNLKNGTKLEVLYKVNGFYKIMINGSAGFVSSQYIDCKYDSYVSQQSLKNVGTISVWTGGSGSSSSNSGVSSSTSSSSSKVTGDQIVTTAKKYLGNPYVYGGTSLTNGTDCSGFTQGVMKIHGITIPRTSSEQSKFGTLIQRAQLQKGDLVFFGTSTSSISHCGIYIGNDQMIHASTSEKGIIISDIDNMGSIKLQVCRRVI
ncbi:MAG: C40 family peptidase [Cellulosilyticum sp.]|nr:C40 family peptidase [Cellulosilyticum sp.]